MFKREKKSNNNNDAADNPFQIFNQGKKKRIAETTENGDAKKKTMHESMSGGPQFERRFAG